MKINKNIIINIIAILVIIALTVAVVILAVNLASKEDTRTDSQKYYDNKCKSYATQNFNLAKGQIVFIGDSITDLYVLDDHYSDLSRATYNRGIGGDTTAGVLKRLKVSLFDIEPSVVVLLIGTNDINGGVDIDLIMERYEAIIDEIYSELPDVELYCMSIIPQNEDLKLDVAKNTEKILEINPRIKTLVESKGATHIDLFTPLADENNHLKKEYSDDGIHLNTAGLSVWTELIKPYLD